MSDTDTPAGTGAVHHHHHVTAISAADLDKYLGGAGGRAPTQLDRVEAMLLLWLRKSTPPEQIDAVAAFVGSRRSAVTTDQLAWWLRAARLEADAPLAFVPMREAKLDVKELADAVGTELDR